MRRTPATWIPIWPCTSLRVSHIYGLHRPLLIMNRTVYLLIHSYIYVYIFTYMPYMLNGRGGVPRCSIYTSDLWNTYFWRKIPCFPSKIGVKSVLPVYLLAIEPISEPRPSSRPGRGGQMDRRRRRRQRPHGLSEGADWQGRAAMASLAN